MDDFLFQRLNTIKQFSTVEFYQKQFELLQSLVAERYPDLEEAYYVTCCINGLKEDIKKVVQFYVPVTVKYALRLATFQESILVDEARTSGSILTSEVQSMNKDDVVVRGENCSCELIDSITGNESKKVAKDTNFCTGGSVATQSAIQNTFHAICKDHIEKSVVDVMPKVVSMAAPNVIMKIIDTEQEGDSSFCWEPGPLSSRFKVKNYLGAMGLDYNSPYHFFGDIVCQGKSECVFDPGGQSDATSVLLSSIVNRAASAHVKLVQSIAPKDLEKFKEPGKLCPVILFFKSSGCFALVKGSIKCIMSSTDILNGFSGSQNMFLLSNCSSSMHNGVAVEMAYLGVQLFSYMQRCIYLLPCYLFMLLCEILREGSIVFPNREVVLVGYEEESGYGDSTVNSEVEIVVGVSPPITDPVCVCIESAEVLHCPTVLNLGNEVVALSKQALDDDVSNFNWEPGPDHLVSAAGVNIHIPLVNNTSINLQSEKMYASGSSLSVLRVVRDNTEVAEAAYADISVSITNQDDIQDTIHIKDKVSGTSKLVTTKSSSFLYSGSEISTSCYSGTFPVVTEEIYVQGYVATTCTIDHGIVNNQRFDHDFLDCSLCRQATISMNMKEQFRGSLNQHSKVGAVCESYTQHLHHQDLVDMVTIPYLQVPWESGPIRSVTLLHNATLFLVYVSLSSACDSMQAIPIIPGGTVLTQQYDNVDKSSVDKLGTGMSTGDVQMLDICPIFLILLIIEALLLCPRACTYSVSSILCFDPGGSSFSMVVYRPSSLFTARNTVEFAIPFWCLVLDDVRYCISAARSTQPGYYIFLAACFYEGFPKLLAPNLVASPSTNNVRVSCQHQTARTAVLKFVSLEPIMVILFRGKGDHYALTIFSTRWPNKIFIQTQTRNNRDSSFTYVEELYSQCFCSIVFRSYYESVWGPLLHVGIYGTSSSDVYHVKDPISDCQVLDSQSHIFELAECICY